MIVLLALFLLGKMSIFLRTKQISKSDFQKLPPGSSGWPVVGETLDLLRANLEGNPLRFTKDRVEKYNSLVFRTSVLGEQMVVICGPAGNKFAFSNEGKKVVLWWPSSLRRLVGPSFIHKVGDEARTNRKLLVSFFSVESLINCIPTIDEVTRNHLATHWQGKEEVKVYPTIKHHIFELACRLFMSISEPELVSRLSVHFHYFSKGLMSIALDFPGTQFHAAMRAAEAIRRELLVLVRQRRIDLNNKVASPTQDLMSFLLSNPDEDGKFMPEVEITNNILGLLYGAHGSSTSTITLLIKYLGELPQVREKVLAEQREIAASKAAGEFLTWEDLKRMRYSWNVVSEVMRMTPPLINMYREALVDIEYEGYTIPKGCKLYLSISFTHDDPNCHPNAMEFNESRFEGSGPPPYSYVPFGGGPRMCLGKEFARVEILIFLHNLVNRFDWDLSIPNEKIIYDPLPVPVNGLPVHLRPRDP
ncbi:hypothetical protein CDL15_Pgr024603 [Punica granatum]|nr:hypothetical protein CDL15_Pgr024603 [Punica granatum]